MATKTVWSILAAVVYVAIVYMLVKPGSPSASAVKSIGDVLTNLFKSATGANNHG